VPCPARLHGLFKSSFFLPDHLMKANCAKRNSCAASKVDMASRRYFDVPNPVIRVSGCAIPQDFDRICSLLTPVVVPEKKASDDIDLEYHLQ
jgi:hypothetical protein